MKMIKQTMLASALAAGMILPAPATVQAQPSAPPSSAQDTTPYVFCWATREIDNGTRRTYYFSSIWSHEGPTVGFQPQFQSFVDERYSNRGGASAQCLSFFGRQEVERHFNNLALQADRDGHERVLTRWSPMNRSPN